MLGRRCTASRACQSETSDFFWAPSLGVRIPAIGEVLSRDAPCRSKENRGPVFHVCPLLGITLRGVINDVAPSLRRELVLVRSALDHLEQIGRDDFLLWVIVYRGVEIEKQLICGLLVHTIFGRHLFIPFLIVSFPRTARHFTPLWILRSHMPHMGTRQKNRHGTTSTGTLPEQESADRQYSETSVRVKARTAIRVFHVHFVTHVIDLSLPSITKRVTLGLLPRYRAVQ